MPTWDDLIPLYTEFLIAGHKSPRTIQLRLYQIKRLARVTGLEPEDVTLQTLTTMQGNPKWKPNTAATARASYASFFGWAHDFEHLPGNVAAKLTSVKVPKGKPKPATDAAFFRALEVAKPRTKIMLRVAAYAGLRAMEIAALSSDDVTLIPNVKKPKKSRAFLTITGKGDKTRIIPISLDLAAELQTYEGFIFPGRINGHLSPAYISKEVSRALPPGVTCHKLRHRYATRAYRNSGHNLLALQKLMGHASPATTGGYADVDDDDLWTTSLSAQ